jgi:hypothetical protein
MLSSKQLTIDRFLIEDVRILSFRCFQSSKYLRSAMRRDSIFYNLFQDAPSLLFELVSEPPVESSNYRFDSVEIKETSFRIDLEELGDALLDFQGMEDLLVWLNQSG